MLRPAVAALERWRAASLANSISLQAATIAIASSLMVAGLSFAVIVWVEHRTLREEHRQAAKRAADRIERALDVIEHVTSQLAKSTMVVGAMLDSRGRAVYLVPFLQNFRFPIDAEGGIALCDINGRRLADNDSPLATCGEDAPAFRELQTDGRPVAIVATGPGGARTWRLYHGVRFPYTGTVEGVLVSQVAFAGLMRDLPEELALDALAIRDSTSGRIVHAVPEARDPGGLAEVRVALPDDNHDGARAPLEVIAFMRSAPISGKVLPLAVAYLGGSVLLVVVVTRRVRKTASRITRPLADLARASRHIARAGTAAPAMLIPPGVSGEVGELASSLKTMVEALRASEGGLEATVQSRTRELRDAEASLRSVFDAAKDIAIIATDESGTVSLFNPGAESLLGHAAADVVGQASLLQFHDPDDLVAHFSRRVDSARDLLDALLAGDASGGATAEQWRCRRKDGSMRDVRLSVTQRLTGEGTRKGFLVIAQDITGQRRAEEQRASLETQLRQSQKMEAIGTLAGGIAHDFNNIIATVLGNTQLAIEDAAGNRPALESLAEIHKAGVRGRDLVQQILSFSRRQPTEKHVVDLAQVTAEAVRLLRRVLPASVSIDYRPRAARRLPVLADASQISQVLVNLGSNALHAMGGAPGALTVELDEAIVEATPGSPAGPCARLTVSDTGAGMGPDVLERIFEPFFTTKPAGEGTGLGLAVVHGIVSGHGGSVRAESPAGCGARFTILLPLAAEEVEKPRLRATASPDAPGRGEHIFYLDDDDALVSLVTRFLERRGYRVSGYTSQAEAIEAVRRGTEPIEIFLTDYNMPGMTGLDVAARLRELRPELPIALASGYVTNELKASAARAGISEVIFKPAAVEGLCDAVQRMIHPKSSRAS